MLRVLAAWGAVASLAACREAVREPEPERVVAWRLVEIEVEGGRELVFEREPAPAPRIEVRLSRRRASVGETVTAVIRLPGSRGVCRIRIRPGRPGVRILGEAEFSVRDEGPVRARFTCDLAGRGGVVVEVVEPVR